MHEITGYWQKGGRSSPASTTGFLTGGVHGRMGAIPQTDIAVNGGAAGRLERIFSPLKPACTGSETAGHRFLQGEPDIHPAFHRVGIYIAASRLGISGAQGAAADTGGVDPQG